MCSDCGTRDPGRRYQIDGTTALLCGPCVRDTIRIAQAHEQLRSIHRAAHGYDGPGCPTCQADPWLAEQRRLEDAELDAAMANVPWPGEAAA